MSFITNWRAKASSHLYSLFSQLFSCCVFFYVNTKEVPISACTSYYTRTEVVEEVAQDFSTCSQEKHHQKQSTDLLLKLQWQIRSLSRNRNSPRAAYSIKSCFIYLRLYMSLLENHAVLAFLQERRKLRLLCHCSFKEPIRKQSSALMPLPCSWRQVDDGLPFGSHEQSPLDHRDGPALCETLGNWTP